MTLVVPSLRSPSYFAASYPFKILYTSMIFLCFLCVRNLFGWPNHLQILCPKQSKNPGQIHLNPAKIDTKTSQNRAQDAPKSRSGEESAGNRVSIPNRSPNYPLLGVSWGVLGASWARLGAVLELSWGVLGRLGRVLGASGDVLGASWNVLRTLHEN